MYFLLVVFNNFSEFKDWKVNVIRSCDGGWINTQDYQNECPRQLHCRQSQQLRDVSCEQLCDRHCNWKTQLPPDGHRLALCQPQHEMRRTYLQQGEDISRRSENLTGVETNSYHISSRAELLQVLFLENISFSAKFYWQKCPALIVRLAGWCKWFLVVIFVRFNSVQ